MAGASSGGAKDSSEPHNRYLVIAAVALWLGGVHANVFVSIIILCFLPNPWAVTFIVKYAPKHFPIEVHVEDMDALDPKRAYVLAVEPHSVLPVSIIVLTKHYGLLPFTKIEALVTSAIFWTPLLRHLGSWMGLASASRKHFIESLKNGCSCILVPGGVQECLFLEYGHETIFLEKRFGFVRGAIETGAPLVPCFCFGQTEIYRFWKPRGQWYATLSRAIGFTPLIFWGMYGSPIPFRHPLYFVVGKPIEVEKKANPSYEEIREVHKKFLAAMEELFEKHKTAAGYKDTTLTVR